MIEPLDGPPKSQLYDTPAPDMRFSTSTFKGAHPEISDTLKLELATVSPGLIVKGREKDFEDVWKNRDTHLADVPGFKTFNLVKGEEKNDHTLYASHSIWNSKDDFWNWTKSEAFKLAHKDAGQHKDLYIGAPDFEGFEKVL